MNRGSVPVVMIGGAVGGALLLALAVFVAYGGAGEKAVRTALDITARWSFLLFWLAYCAGALGVLFRPAFGSLARRGRDLGLSFAAAHLVHIGLVVWLGLILNRVPLHGWLLVFFAVGIFFTYLLVLLSFGLAEVIGPRLWQPIMFLAMNYILIAFGRDFVVGTIHSQAAHREWWRITDYAVLALLCILAPLLRLAAAMRRRWEMQPAAMS